MTTNDYLPQTFESSKVKQWVARIQPYMTATVEAYIATGQAFIDAKADCDHGEFGAVCKALGQSWSTVERLMVIARADHIRRSAQSLPAAWTTLYALTALSPEQLASGIESGAIHPAMTRAAATALVKPEPEEEDDEEETTEPTDEDDEVIDGEVVEDEPDFVTQENEEDDDEDETEDEDSWYCPRCNAMVDDDERELVKNYECSECGDEFPDDEGNRCPSCHKFASRIDDTYRCPDCGEDLEEQQRPEGARTSLQRFTVRRYMALIPSVSALSMFRRNDSRFKRTISPWDALRDTEKVALEEEITKLVEGWLEVLQCIQTTGKPYITEEDE